MMSDAKEANAANAADPAAKDEAPVLRLTEPPKGNIVLTAWLVLFLAVAFGAGLAGVETWLKPKIEKNKLDESLSKVPSLVPGAKKGVLDQTTIPSRNVFRALDASGKLIGWVVAGSDQGFADKVEVLIGLDPTASKLTGIYVLDQKETPGLGDNIRDIKFRKRFVGMKVGAGRPKLFAKQDATDGKLGRIRAVTGATISSETVCRIINKTVASVQKKLSAATNKGG